MGAPLPDAAAQLGSRSGRRDRTRSPPRRDPKPAAHAGPSCSRRRPPRRHRRPSPPWRERSCAAPRGSRRRSRPA
ncbi:MAG: hypothetical protein FJ222_05425 [Lentisphaerae bacterium]|nr:hypothetical protein [Lentisphaerota bacterium]